MGQKKVELFLATSTKSVFLKSLAKQFLEIAYNSIFSSFVKTKQGSRRDVFRYSKAWSYKGE
jgi:hypothetical protein